MVEMFSVFNIYLILGGTIPVFHIIVPVSYGSLILVPNPSEILQLLSWLVLI